METYQNVNSFVPSNHFWHIFCGYIFYDEEILHIKAAILRINEAENGTLCP
jgi:hypothetical protein